MPTKKTTKSKSSNSPIKSAKQANVWRTVGLVAGIASPLLYLAITFIVVNCFNVPLINYGASGATMFWAAIRQGIINVCLLLSILAAIFVFAYGKRTGITTKDRVIVIIGILLAISSYILALFLPEIVM